MLNRIETLAQSICAQYFEHEKAKWDYESEQIKLGDIPDKTKLRLLKDYMFSRVHGDRDVSQILRAIHILENSIDRKHKRDYHPLNLINSLLCTGFALSFLVGCFSFPVTAICKQYNSPFCNTSRAITYSIAQQFQEPTNNK